MHTVFDKTNPEQLTLVDILRWRALYDPQIEAYTFLLDGGTKQVQMTYAGLDHQARSIAALLQDRVAPGERVLLLYPPGLEYVGAIFGCFYAGVVAVPAYPPRRNQNLQRIQTILQDAQAMVALTTSTILSSLHHTEALDPLGKPKSQIGASPIRMQDLQWIATDTMGPLANASYREPYVAPEVLALLQYTSGSTGSPKGIMLTHTNLVQNAALIQEGMSLTSQDRGLFWLPPYHDMGLMGGILQALYTGFPATLMAPAAFLQQPLRWLQALSSWQATVSGAPNFAYDLCVKQATQDNIKTLNLSHWAVAFTGAEPVRTETLSRFAATFAACGFRPEAFYPCYGLAEATLFVSGSRRLAKPKIRTFERDALESGRVVETTGENVAARLLVSCGFVQQEQEVVIVNLQTRTCCAVHTVGEIWVRSSNIATGYWGKPEETTETFQAFLHRDAEASREGSDEGPFLRTGDLGFCVGNELYVTGRLKDLIIIRGRNLYPQDIEQVVEKSHALLRQGCCAAFAIEGPEGEQLVVVQEVVRHADDAGIQEAIQSIRRAVLSEFDVEVVAIALLRASTIPKTSSGKIQRRACRSRFLANELNTISRWSHTQEVHHLLALSNEGDEVETGSVQGAIPTIIETGLVPTFGPKGPEIADWLVEHIAKHVHIAAHTVDRHASFVQFGLNSLEVMGFSGALEQWLGCSLSPTLLYDYPSIDTLARYLEDVIRDQHQESNEVTLLPQIVPAPTQQYLPFPNTDVQQAYWIGRSSLFELGNVGNHAYIEVEAVSLDLARSLQILRQLIKRHPMLRAVMLPDGQQQILEHVPPVQVEWIDLSGLEQQELVEQLARTRNAMDHQVFQVEQWPAWTIRVSQLQERRIRIHISMEVLFVDAWSLSILLQEFLHLYHEPEASLPPLDLTFRDYVTAAVKLQNLALYRRARNYWRERLQHLPAAPTLPLAIDPAALSRPRFVPRSARIEATQWQRLKTRGAQAGLTPSGILLAAFAEVLTMWSKTPQFCINLTIFQRFLLHEQVDEIVGDFTSSLLLAIDNASEDSFEQRARRIQEQMHRDLRHYYYSGVRVLRDLARIQGSKGGAYSHPPQASMPVVFTSLLAHKIDVAYPGPWQEITCYVTQTPQVWLDHQVLEVDGHLVLYWQAVEALFPPGLLDAMFGAYTQLLERLVTDDEVWRQRDSVLLPPSQLALLKRINATDAPIVDTLLHSLFLEQARRQPDQLAIISARRTLTYQEVSRGTMFLAYQMGTLSFWEERISRSKYRAIVSN